MREIYLTYRQWRDSSLPGGGDEGFVATLIFYPTRDIGLVVMTNATNGAFINEMTRAFTAEFVK